MIIVSQQQTHHTVTLIYIYIKIHTNEVCTYLYPAKSSSFIIYNPPNRICGTHCNECKDYGALWYSIMQFGICASHPQ